MSRKSAQDKGKRKMGESAKVEQSYKFKEDPLAERVDLEIEAMRWQCDRRVAQRKRENKSLEETKRRFQEMEKKLTAEEELRRRENKERQKQQHEEWQGALTKKNAQI